MREWYGSLDGGKVVDLMLVEVDLEDESLRSDTRLPLESSPYMAGRNLNSSTGSLPTFLFLPFNNASPARLLLFPPMPPTIFFSNSNILVLFQLFFQS